MTIIINTLENINTFEESNAALKHQTNPTELSQPSTLKGVNAAVHKSQAINKERSPLGKTELLIQNKGSPTRSHSTHVRDSPNIVPTIISGSRLPPLQRQKAAMDTKKWHETQTSWVQPKPPKLRGKMPIPCKTKTRIGNAFLNLDTAKKFPKGM